MRIALLGPARVIHYQRWAYSLAALGHEVHVISQHRDESMTESAAFASQTWLPFQGTWGYAGNIPVLRRTIKTIRPDIVNTHYASGYGLCASSITDYPHLLSVWGSDVYDFPNESLLKKKILLWNLSRTTALASTSRVMKQQVLELYPRAPEIFITPFGVDCTKFFPRATKDNATITIGIIKTLAIKYGVDLLLEAFANLLALPTVQAINAKKPLRLLIIGDGPQREALVRRAEELGISNRVEFVGHVAHNTVPFWLRKIDIFVAPSRLDSESFGVAAVEASACGVPVIVSDAGGLPEVVENGVTGIVVPKNDIQNLTLAMERLVLNPELRSALGNAGRQLVIKKYDWQFCVENMIECYEKTIKISTGFR